MNTRRWWWIHSLSAVWASGFLVFLFATGVLALFADPALRWENRVAAYVDPASGWNWSKVGPALAAAREHAAFRNPGLTLQSIRLPASPHHALLFGFLDPDRRPRPFGSADAEFARGVFVDPGSNRVTGGYDALRSIDGYLRALHVRFFAGTTGRNVAGLFGAVLLIATASGCCIVLKFLRGRQLLKWNRSSLRAFASDGHKAIGLATLPFLVVFAVTGFWLGLQGRLMTAFDIPRPEGFERAAVTSAGADSTMEVDWAAARERVRAEFPDLMAEELLLSSDGSRTLTVAGRVPGMLAERRTPRLVLDKQTLAPLFRLDPRDVSPGVTLFLIQEPLHFGDFAGTWSLAVWAAAGSLLVALGLAGSIVYLKRSRRNLTPLFGWSAFGLGYTVLCLGLHKSLGYFGALSYGLPLFFAALLLSLLLLLRHRRKNA